MTSEGSPFYDEVHKWTYGNDYQFGGDKASENARQALIMRYRMDLRSARRFVVSGESAALAAEMSMNMARLPLMINLARLPFDKMWIEWDGEAFNREIRKRNIGGRDEREENRDADPRRPKSGLLITRAQAGQPRWEATVFETLANGDVVPTPIAYVVDPEGSEERPVAEAIKERAIHLVSERLRIRGEMIAMAIGDPDSEEQRQAFQNGEWLLPKIGLAQEPMFYLGGETSRRLIKWKSEERRLKAKEVVAALMDEQASRAAGRMKVLIALIAIMNEAPVSFTEVPARRGSMTAKGRTVSYMDHQIATIDVAPRRALPTISRLLREAFAKRRAHEVRGHWRRIAAMPDHESGKHAVGTDGRPRVWIEKHVRGDASIGWVQKDYAVQAGNPVEGARSMA